MNKEEFSLSKTTVECYKIRHKTGMYWADITVDAQEKGGRIQIASDYGDWQNYWPVPGSEFKLFLMGLDMDYLSGKLGAHKHFDHQATIKAFKIAICEYRRNDNIRADRAREIFDQIKALEDSPYRDEFMIDITGMGRLMEFFDWSPDFHYTHAPGFKQFWKYVWPVFVAELKAELESIPSSVNQQS